MTSKTDLVNLILAEQTQLSSVIRTTSVLSDEMSNLVRKIENDVSLPNIELADKEFCNKFFVAAEKFRESFLHTGRGIYFHLFETYKEEKKATESLAFSVVMKGRLESSEIILREVICNFVGVKRNLLANNTNKDEKQRTAFVQDHIADLVFLRESIQNYAECPLRPRHDKILSLLNTIIRNYNESKDWLGNSVEHIKDTISSMYGDVADLLDKQYFK